jgi:hypothetical protein
MVCIYRKRAPQQIQKEDVSPRQKEEHLVQIRGDKLPEPMSSGGEQKAESASATPSVLCLSDNALM